MAWVSAMHRSRWRHGCNSTSLSRGQIREYLAGEWSVGSVVVTHLMFLTFLLASQHRHEARPPSHRVHTQRLCHARLWRQQYGCRPKAKARAVDPCRVGVQQGNEGKRYQTHRLLTFNSPLRQQEQLVYTNGHLRVTKDNSEPLQGASPVNLGNHGRGKALKLCRAMAPLLTAVLLHPQEATRSKATLPSCACGTGLVTALPSPPCTGTACRRARQVLSPAGSP